MSGKPLVWRCRGRAIECGARTLVMGILNVTPDSFSDGGRFLNHDAAVAHAVQMVADGADILDVGGESTRPGSDDIPPNEERDRVMPVIERLVKELPDVAISIDTRKRDVAAAALESGAAIVNDVSAGADPAMFDLVRDAGAGLILMHMQGDPKTMQQAPYYDDVVGEVKEFLRERMEAAIFAGIGADALCVDPGVGFGKNLEHNLALMANVAQFVDLGAPVLVGPSRKAFIGMLLDLPVDERVEGTAGAVAWLAGQGAHIVRVHDVKEMARVIRVVDAIRQAGS